MSNLIQQLTEKGLAHPPTWLSDNCLYLTQMGSTVYGCTTDSSDFDLYGFAVPPKHIVFPNLAGHIRGFGNEPAAFDQWQEHHVFDSEALGGKGRTYDFSVYGIVNYFHLAMQNNPNILEALYTPRECVLHSTAIAEMVRERRSLFLHKGCFHKMVGYARAQLKKMDSRAHVGMDELMAFERDLGIPHNTPWLDVEKAYKKRSVGCEILSQLSNTTLERYYVLFEAMMRKAKRGELVKRFGFDTKHGSHLIRLVNQCEQALVEGTIDLRRSAEHMKAIRRGDVPIQDIKAYFTEKELILNKLYHESKLPDHPNEEAIKALLLDCLEQHYGNLGSAIVREDAHARAFRDLAEVVNRHRALFDATTTG